jgi:putative peptidoglycan lipid II flippase
MMISRLLESIGLRPTTPDRPMTTNWKIFRAVVIVGGCSVIAKLASTGKEVAVANWFGRGDALDAFLLALLLPASIASFIAAAFSATLVPVYIKTRDQQGSEAAQQLFSSLQVVVFLTFAAVSILLVGTARLYLPLLGGGFSPAKLVLTRHLLYTLTPFVVLSGMVAVWSAVLNSREKFALPALTPVITPVVIFGFLFITGRKLGVFSLAAGTVIGSAIEISLLARALTSHGFRLLPRWYGSSPELRLIVRQALPLLSSSVIMSASPIIDQAMAASLSTGSVAALSYGNKAITALTTLFSVALYTAVLPYFSKMVAGKDWFGCRRTLKVYSFLVLAATVPITLGLIAGSTPLVRLLFQRGAFTAQDTKVVSAVQMLFAISIPFYTWAVLFVRVLTSLNRTDLMAYIAVMNTVLNVVLNVIFMRKLGVSGIALSTSIVYANSCLFLGLLTLRLLSKEENAAAQCSLADATMVNSSET